MNAQGVQKWHNGTCPVTQYRLPMGAMCIPPKVFLARETDTRCIRDTILTGSAR